MYLIQDQGEKFINSKIALELFKFLMVGIDLNYLYLRLEFEPLITIISNNFLSRGQTVPTPNLTLLPAHNNRPIQTITITLPTSR